MLFHITANPRMSTPKPSFMYILSNSGVDQDGLRQMLYQARALLGELRIEEQAWNGEVNSEKTLRKEVNDFAKV